MQPEDIDNRFDFHPAKSDVDEKSHEEVRERCKQLGQALNALVPEGREKSLAFTNLEQVMMWANAGIARARE